ncbi:unnamed protein product [Rotaria sp. Silwood2]|nr:unnamed protein product [Rotaria sp. Silwood2]CAF2937584.1 unnamed protein product [Rotaria sp. Silwood2]CAF3194558.1 unnamed protein product [Rotaria sp. Silwood2]CAF3337545.1 unnamed protein product [Rotaria sp. Silwood2]CAF4126048.1 unnamed protein product [Rotaria sp. Silwood2]
MSFSDEQLLLFLDKVTDLYQLVKLDIRNLKGAQTGALLKKVLAANNNRLKSVLFDDDSMNFILPSTENGEVVSYRNIEELVVNIKTDKTLGYLFTLVPHINRLHINIHQISSDSKLKLANALSLVHLKDFQLCSMNARWSLDEIAYILSKMPSLQRLALNLSSKDAHLVNGQNFIKILPSSLVEIHLFIMYFFYGSHMEVNNLLSTWPTHIQITCLPDKPNEYAVIHTIPCSLPLIVIPGTLANSMLVGSEYTRQVRDLRIRGEQSFTDIHLIVQHFHRLRKLNIGSIINSKARMRFFTRNFSTENLDFISLMHYKQCIQR